MQYFFIFGIKCFGNRTLRSFWKLFCLIFQTDVLIQIFIDVPFSLFQRFLAFIINVSIKFCAQFSLVMTCIQISNTICISQDLHEILPKNIHLFFFVIVLLILNLYFCFIALWCSWRPFFTWFSTVFYDIYIVRSIA